MAVPGVPKVPFNIEEDFLAAILGDDSNKADDTKTTVEGAGGGRVFLPDLKTLTVHSQLARLVLRAITKHRAASSFSHCLRAIGTVELRNWGCSVPQIDQKDAGHDSVTPSTPNER